MLRISVFVHFKIIALISYLHQDNYGVRESILSVILIFATANQYIIDMYYIEIGGKDMNNEINSKWDEIKSDYIDDENICYIDAWKRGSEQGETVAWIDMLSGRIIYCNTEMRTNDPIKSVAEAISVQVKKQHPYSVIELEGILRDVVSYECEELESGVDVTMNLISMGFSVDSMHHFGFPEIVEEDNK